MSEKKDEDKYPDAAEVEFGDGWIEEQLKARRKNPKGCHRPAYTDTRCMGLMCWFAKNNRDVTFFLRMRVAVKGYAEKQRKQEKIGKWVAQKGALNVARARMEANFRRSKYELEGFEEAAEIPLLKFAISCEEKGKEGYEQFRRRADPRTARGGARLPDSWPGHINRFREIHKEYLEQPVTALNYDNMIRTRNAYIAARLPDADDEKAFDAELKKVRSCYTTVMPMLEYWFRNTWGWIGRDQQVRGLIPKAYKKSRRYVYPGEWQASQDALDALEAEVPGAGLFVRFIFASGARTEASLLMKWDDLSWGDPDSFMDFDGIEQQCLIWLPPPETMKGRGGEDDEEKPCKLLITGSAFDILKRLRVIYENRKREDPESSYTGVFPPEAVALWQNSRSTRQREIERQGGTGRWHRKALRHSHATYLQFLDCPMALVTMTLTHTPSMQGVAPSTAVYANASRMVRFSKNEPLAALGPWHIRLQKLIRDMEEGNADSPELIAIGEAIRRDTTQRVTQERYGINPKHRCVEPRVRTPRLRIVG